MDTRSRSDRMATTNNNATTTRYPSSGGKLLCTMLLLTVVAARAPTAAATGNTPAQTTPPEQPPSLTVFPPSSPSSCVPHFCSSNTTQQWPLHLAVELPRRDWGTFSLTVERRDGSDDSITLEFECTQHLDKNNSVLVVLTARHKQQLLAGPVLVVLPQETWFTVFLYTKPQALVCVTQVTATAGQWEHSAQNIIRVPFRHLENGNSSVTASCKEESGVNIDFLCFQDPSAMVTSTNATVATDESYSTVDEDKSIGDRRKTRGPIVPSANVIWTISVCGALVLLLLCLFAVWYRQRKMLKQRRNSYQHNLMKLQQSKQNVEQQQVNYHQLQQQISPTGQQEQQQQGVKPRTFVRPQRCNSHCSEDSNFTTTTIIDDDTSQSYANVATDPSIIGFSNNEEGAVGNLSDDGGISGPYWFHSNRTDGRPQVRHKLKIYKV